MKIEGLHDEAPLKLLERLTEKGYLINNQQFEHGGYSEFASGLLNISPFVDVICSMKNLRTMFLDCELTLENLAHVFQSCYKLIELQIPLFMNTAAKECETLE
jgi:hypothetical protein